MKRLEWIFDYYIAYFLYNGMKRDVYNQYMRDKWGDKFKNKLNG
jgi:hypothetical protein